jgi:two-component system, NtrC family, response regulator GlrR
MATKAKVLVVDDDQPTRELVVEALEDEGYFVEMVEDGSHALAALEAASFDIVLLDLRMPGTDGASLFRLLNERGLATMPIILMTADNNAMQELIARGVKFILLKPFDLDALLNCVAGALRSPKETEQQGIPIAVGAEAVAAPDDVHICQ